MLAVGPAGLVPVAPGGVDAAGRLAKGDASAGGAESGAPRAVRRRGVLGVGVAGAGVGPVACRGAVAAVRWIGAASPDRGLCWARGAVRVTGLGVGREGASGDAAGFTSW
ncbi:hypothetical protein GCM10009540_25560 [Streptomyces turgidiscabies]